jgi:hypothetical protein
MATQRIQVKDNDFESPYTDNEVARVFRQMVENDVITSNFGRDLYNGARRFGKYTPGQVPWLHVLVAQAEGRPTKPQPQVLNQGGYAAIHAHLMNCRESREKGGKGLLHPMVGLQVGEQQVVLKLAGAKSRHSGKVSVASDHRYGQGQFYGWIDATGNFETRGCPQVVVDILNRVAANPTQAIEEIGKESGRCCYCFAALTQVSSKIAGCGKTCAENYGHEYPSTAEIRAFVQVHPEILEGASDRDKWEPQPVS